MSEFVIPEHLRSKTVIIGACHTRDEVRAGIIKLVEMSELQCSPLRHVSCRFAGAIKKLGMSLGDFLAEMESEGLIGLKRVDMLSRTYVFSARSWTEIVEEEIAGTLNWAKYAEALRDYK